ncbi:hypothetical protein CBS101457_003072 [Exobasidium rhododendri]|nr:hypothetical protein CBS101457_003072 [Exobasidium rhododendri]
MQLSNLFVVLAIATASASAASINVNARDISVSSFGSLESHPIFSRSALAARAESSSLTTYETQGAAAQKTASSQYESQTAALQKLSTSTVTEAQLKPIIAQITATTNTAGNTFQSLSTQAKAAKNSKRQALLVPAVDQLVIDLNKTLTTLQPLLLHLTTNLELGTVQELVDGLTPALTTLILGVEGLLVTLAPGLSTIVDPLLTVVYGLTDALGLNLNL